MSTLILPSFGDARDTIAGYLAALPVNALTSVERSTIITNCLEPFSLLVQAVERACAAGPVEEQIFIQIIRGLNAHVEADTKKKQFAGLLHKLNACKPFP